MKREQKSFQYKYDVFFCDKNLQKNISFKSHGGELQMARSNRYEVPEAKEAMNKFKMEVANEVGVNLKQGYNGDLTSRQAGSIGGNMVKKMIHKAESEMK